MNKNYLYILAIFLRFFAVRNDKIAEELMCLKFSFRKLDSDYGIDHYFYNGKQFVLLYLLENGNAAFPKELSRDMSTSTARVAGILRKLEADGLICRTADQADNRKVLVSLTDKGESEATRIRNTVNAVIENIISILGPEDSMEYIRINKKLLKSIVKEDDKLGGENSPL